MFERGHAGVRLTTGGKALLPHIRRALAELDAIRHAGDQNGNGIVGEVRVAVRMPPVGEPLGSLLSGWRERHPEVVLSIAEMNEWEIQRAERERRIDVALMTSHTLWPDAVTAPLYRERIVAAIPCEHPLSEHDSVDWTSLRKETFLVQAWDNSHSAREFYSSFMGCGVRFESHAGSKQCVFALVGVRDHPHHDEPGGSGVPGRRLSADPRGERLGAGRARVVPGGRRPGRRTVRRLHAR